MANSLDLFQARSQLMAHRIGCLCAPCRDARQLVDEAAEQHRQRLHEAGEAWAAEVNAGQEGGRE